MTLPQLRGVHLRRRAARLGRRGRADAARSPTVFDAADEVRIVGAGTDLTLSLAGRHGAVDDGHVNMPGGEVFYSPRRGLGDEGVIEFGEFPAVYYGHEVDGVRLVFERRPRRRRVGAQRARTSCSRRSTPTTARAASASSASAATRGIQRFMKNVGFDEKIDGTVHLALGNSYTFTGGTNESAIHWDIVKDLRSDGESISTARRAAAVVQRDGALADALGERRRRPRRSRPRAARSPTIRSRFARSVRPPLSRCRIGEDERRHGLPVHALGRRVGERALDQRLDVVEALVGRPADEQPAAAELPVGGGDLRRLGGGLDARRRPAGRRAPRRRAAASSVRQPSTGTPSVSSSSAVAGTSSSDLTPDETTSDLRLARARLQVGRDVRRRRPAAVDAAEAAGRHDRGSRPPCRRRACRRPSSRRSRAARRRRRGRAARACAPTRRTARAPRSRQADDDLAVERRRSSPAPRRRRGPPAPRRARPRRLRPAGSRARRASSRARRRRARPRCASRTSSASRITASLPAARSSARRPRARARGPPTRKPAASASPAPVGSTTSTRRARDGRRRRP